jgi:hypothetical protein
MTKPIGYYTSVMPGDGSYLDELQEEYGSTFERMPRTLKAHLLVEIAKSLLTAEVSITGTIQADIELQSKEEIAQNIYRSVPIKEQIGWAEAIINQLKAPRGEEHE